MNAADILSLIHNEIVPREELHEDTPLFSEGILNSMNLIELVEALETRYRIKITPTEITLENLDSPRRIAAFVERKRPVC